MNCLAVPSCLLHKPEFSANGLLCLLFHVGILLSFFVDPEDRDMFLRNEGWLWMDYTALYPRRHNSSKTVSHFYFVTSVTRCLKQTFPKVFSTSWAELYKTAYSQLQAAGIRWQRWLETFNTIKEREGQRTFISENACKLFPLNPRESACLCR
jgi:hypothetical protein